MSQLVRRTGVKFVFARLPFQRSGWYLCVWAAGTRSTTSTFYGSPRTWSGMPPVSNVPSAASTLMSPARALSGTERHTVNGITSGRTTETGVDNLLQMHDRSRSYTAIGIIIILHFPTISKWELWHWFKTYGAMFSLSWTLWNIITIVIFIS